MKRINVLSIIYLSRILAKQFFREMINESKYLHFCFNFIYISSFFPRINVPCSVYKYRRQIIYSYFSFIHDNMRYFQGKKHNNTICMIKKQKKILVFFMIYIPEPYFKHHKNLMHEQVKNNSFLKFIRKEVNNFLALLCALQWYIYYVNNKHTVLYVKNAYMLF